ncbi:MAG TPA: MOSC domain-containing protein [Planctomycetota bacterium]|nr:MOSC domain-containing protein [Planctomycetota bacterium]
MIDLSWRFDSWFDALPRSPKERGSVHGLVLRTGHGLRETPAEIELVKGAGAVGDAWSSHPHSEAGNELAMINVHVLRAVCEGDEARMALSGDNLHVDLDLSEENLPVGTRLEVGEALLRVSELPHRPCKHFVERFGATAAKRVARANRRGQRARGVLCTIERGGRVRQGDPIRVLRDFTPK